MSSHPPPSRPTRLAACLVCRRSKIKCIWDADQARCQRCVQLSKECIRPDVHIGRQKGIKNKRVGLDKALYQVEQAVRRSASGRDPGPGGGDVLSRLRNLLDEADAAVKVEPAVAELRDADEDEVDEDEMDDDESSSEGYAAAAPGTERHLSSSTPGGGESLAVDDAENPLQLLARASYFQPHERPAGGAPETGPATVATERVPSTAAATATNTNSAAPAPTARSKYRARDSHASPASASSSKPSHEAHHLRRFFASGVRAHLDVGPDLDPIELGLATMDEATLLFDYFHKNLAHTRWGLDPRIYTLRYTRTRSALLTTSIMAASALFWSGTPEAAALLRRLSGHARRLADGVLQDRRYKSVEIVLALLANIPWMSPGPRSTDDDTSVYIAMAMTMAIDLCLHKVLVPPGGGPATATVARGECLDTRTALDMDGFPDVDPASDRGVLLLRGRERCWISLFVLERGMCLARGRPFAVPVTRSLKDCDSWHRSPLAESQDGPLLSMAVMRRDLDGLFTTVRNMCDRSQTPSSDGSLAAQAIESCIEAFFTEWHARWAPGTRGLPPYVDILVTHTRLSLYGSVINHPTASLEVRRYFRTAGLSSALGVMRAAIRGESQLRSMPNNTAIMISFAACFALTLSAYASDGSSLAPSIRKLIDEAAGVLVRTGLVTPHRNGLSTLYGRHLRHIVRRASPAAGADSSNNNNTSNNAMRALPMVAAAPVPTVEETSPSTVPAGATPMTVPDLFVPEQNMAPMPQYQHQHPQPQQQQQQQQQSQLMWPETLQFSAMSDDQIMHVLNQPANDFEPTFEGLSWDDMSHFDWLHWPEFSS